MEVINAITIPSVGKTKSRRSLEMSKPLGEEINFCLYREFSHNCSVVLLAA